MFGLESSVKRVHAESSKYRVECFECLNVWFSVECFGFLRTVQRHKIQECKGVSSNRLET